MNDARRLPTSVGAIGNGERVGPQQEVGCPHRSVELPHIKAAVPLHRDGLHSQLNLTQMRSAEGA